MTPLDLGDDLLTGATPRPLLTQGDNHLFVTRERGEPAEVFLGDDPDSDPSILQITHPDDGIQFWRRLARASIFGELTVQLGLPGRSFALGPDVTLEVGIVEVPSRSVRVLTRASRRRR